MFESLERLSVLVPWLKEDLKTKLISKRDVLFGDWAVESPRLFEAAAMGVCQILEEDVYLNGAMEPWVHYLPLASDFSNLDRIFEFIRDDERVLKVVEAARALLVESDKYSYQSFVQSILSQELENFHYLNQEPSNMVDEDWRFPFESEAVKARVRSLFFDTSLIRLIGIHLRFRNSQAMLNYRQLTALEVVPDIFTIPWVPVSDSSSGAL
jgi:hypothetical protein